MSERKKQILLEAYKKSKKESVMGKLANGDTDPMEPWSKKHAPLDEVNTQILWKYIKAMGRDPRTISLNDRLNLARTDRFKKFSRDHMKYTDMGTTEEVEGVAEETVNEMDKSAPQPGRDGKVSHSTYGSRDKEGSDYFKGKESPAKAITVKQAKKDALDIMRKLGMAEETEKKYYAIVHKTSKKVHSTYRNLDTAKHVYRQMDKDLRPHLTVMATSNPGDIKEKTVNEAGTGTLMSYIKAKGLNPLSMDGNQKNKYSKSSEFKLFKHRKMKAETSGMSERDDDWNEEVENINELKKQSDTQDLDSHITREDLRKWFSKTDPEGGWKRINSKGEAIGPCAREPGEPKPKCMSNEKRAKLSKKERAAAVAAKRKHDPVADRAGKGGKPVNVSNFGKGKLSKESVDEACWDTHKQVGMKKKGNKMVPDCVPKNEENEMIDEKNSPTNPKLWARAKSLARSKFDVYPSAYANGWASKWYKSKGGGWRATSEETVSEGIYGIEDSPLSANNSVKAMESKMTKEKSKSARMIKAIYKKKGLKKETIYDWEKTEKGGKAEGDAKYILKGGTTMTGKPRDTIEIEPVVRTKLNSPNGMKSNP
jgi:hypothetical protein